VLPSVIVWGRPDCAVQVPPICHPPTTPLKTGFLMFRAFPLPIGRSYSTAVKKRFRTSNEEGPRSHWRQLLSCGYKLSNPWTRIPLVLSIDFENVYELITLRPAPKRLVS